MKLLSDLRAEHDLIEKVIASLQTFAARRSGGGGDPADGPAFLCFFRLYAGRYHHAREEDSLFPALVEHTEAPADCGPISTLRSQHASIAAILDEAEPLLIAAQLDERDGRRLRDLCARHGGAAPSPRCRELRALSRERSAFPSRLSHGVGEPRPRRRGSARTRRG